MKTGVEVRPDNSSPQWTKTVFIDGKQLPRQICEDPVIEGNICVVRCLTDKRIGDPLDPKTVAYQAKPYVTEIEKEGVNASHEVTTFYLLME